MARKIESAVLAQRIRELDGLTNDERSALLELLNTEKRYGLFWENKPEEVEERLRDSLPVLTEVKERAIINGSDHPNHIIIEGDNLEALTALSYTHEGKIDVIYIDPPYNTGNRDFVYNDNYVDTEDGYRHSKWLSFMSRRLKIAKRLLSERGVIFISIDDNEQANLKLLCDEVFGENNFIGDYIWHKKTQPSFLTNELINVTEYVIIYKKQNVAIPFFGGYSDLNKAVEMLNSPNAVSDRVFVKESVIIGNGWTGILKRGEYGNANLKVILHEDLSVIEGKPDKDIKLTGRFKWQQSKINQAISEGGIISIKSISTLRPTLSRGKNAVASIKPPINLLSKLLNDEIPTNTDATNEMKNMFDGISPMSYPKPTRLLEFVIKSVLFNQMNSTILDFFAGSGTTLHATMQLNEEDGGHRQCILVTNNENNICEEVTYERNRRVINGYTTPKGVAVEGLHENNLRYYRTDLLPRARTMRNMRALVAAATDLLCIKEDLYDEVNTFGSINLKPRLARLFVSGKRQMLVIYREETVPRLVKEMERMDFAEPIKIYLFSPGRYAFDDDFFTVQDKVKLCALPAAIYDAYRQVLPKRRPAQPFPEMSALPEYDASIPADSSRETSLSANSAQTQIDFIKEEQQ